MKAVVVLVTFLSIAGLAAAQYDAFCSANGVYTVAHPTLCTKFIYCVSNVATVLPCLDGQFYDSIYNACRDQDVAHCEHIPSNSVPDYVLQICASIAPVPNGQTIPAVACDKYYVCSGTKAFELSCPNGQHYSRAYSACMNPLKAGCRALNTMCIGEYPGFMFPSLTCENYYVCDSNLMPEAKSCDAGLYFNVNNGTCSLPALSGCVNEGNSEPGNPSTANPGDNETTPPSDNNTTVDTPPTCSSNGQFWAHPKCNWFYMCYNMTALEFQCECGQYFDNSVKYCVPDTNKTCLD